MGRRRSPYLTKTEAGKNRRNKNTVTDYTSQDFTQTRYDYTNKYKNYKDYFTSDVYDSRLHSPKRKGSGESYTFDDYTTSGISYDELKRRPNDLIYSVSTSDYVYESPEKYNNISFRDYDHSYPKGSRSREKKRLRLSKDSNKTNYNDLLDESGQYLDRDRRYRSPRSRYYHDLIHEEPEKEFEYEQYFEKTRPKVGSSPKQRRQDKYDERYEKQTKLQSRTPKNRIGYQVYAYQDTKHHEDIFKSKNHPGDLSLSSEVEIKTHEYPVLAFKDATSGKKDSDMVYLPIIVLDKKSGKSRPGKSTDESIYQTNKDNFQIYAANLQEQKNIFQQFGGLPNTIKSKEPTSRLLPDFGVEATSGMRYADSLLGTIIDEAVEVDTDYRNEDRMIETIADQRIPFTTGRRPFTYQVDVDISPNGPTSSMKDKQSCHIKNSSVNDPLHDGYPVTKDYIKVSESQQNRKSLAPLISKDANNPSSLMGQKISDERKSNAIKEEAQRVKLIDDKTISMSIAQSKAIPALKSIMRTPSQVSLDEQPLNKELSSSMRQNVALGTKQNSRASHIGPAEKADRKGKPPTKMSVLKEETSQDLRKSMKTGTAQRHSVVRSSKVASSGFAMNTTGADSSHNLLHDIDRKSVKPGMHSEETADRRSKVQTTLSTPPPVSDDKKSVLHSQTNQDKKSTVAHMVDISSPSSQNKRASQAQSRKSAVEGGRSKVQTMQQTPSSPVSDHRKSVWHSQSGQDRKGTAAQMVNTNPPASQAQSRQSAVAPRPSAADLSGDNRQSMKTSAPRQSQKAVPASVGKKSLVQSSAHHNTHIVAGNNNAKLSHQVNKRDSEDALRQFTKDVFQVDLGSDGKKSSHKNEQKKPTASAVRPSHGAESNHQLRKSAVGQQPLNGQSQNALGNVEPSHEQIGDNSAGIGKAPTVEEGKRKTRSLLRTTSNMFRTLSKIGKKKSKEQVDKPYISTGSPTGSKKSEGKSKPAKTTQDNDDSHFVRSIEPTVTQYKKEQNKAQTLTKSKSKPDTKVPKEKKSLTKLFSRSKSKLNNESGDDSKKKKKKKSRSLLGILKRGSKSSEVLTTTPAEGVEPAGEDKQALECECFAHYVQNTRVCAYFFLGTTLHEQIMNIIKVFLGGS